MERKIGEIFEYNGEWYQCVESDNCGECSPFTTQCSSGTKSDLAYKVFGKCSKTRRSDNKFVIFKKLEKVGNPIRLYNDIDSLFQKYKLFVDAVIPKEFGRSYSMFPDNSYIKIELKQNKEDMEENKLNLKPFSLEAAKAGKPVCTRDGRKARIICFDAKRKDKKSIIALIPSKDYPGFEDLIAYPNNGNYHGGHENDGDLMMLPEKHEGWVNILRYSNDNYVDNIIYATEELAKKTATKKNGVKRIATVKISWEE